MPPSDLSEQPAHVARLITYFETLSPGQLVQLGAYYSPKVIFKDPFNDVQGLAALTQVFEHMYRSLERPHFVVTAAITQGQIDKQSVAVSLAVESAASATAGVIAKIRVQHTTIRQEVEREIRENVVYRDCQHSPVQLQRINAALTGARPEPAGGGKLPPADPADRPVIRRDDFEAD